MSDWFEIRDTRACLRDRLVRGTLYENSTGSSSRGERRSKSVGCRSWSVSRVEGPAMQPAPRRLLRADHRRSGSGLEVAVSLDEEPQAVPGGLQFGQAEVTPLVAVALDQAPEEEIPLVRL